MKFLMFALDGSARLGVLESESSLIDITSLLESAPEYNFDAVPKTIHDVMALGDSLVEFIANLLTDADEISTHRFAVENVKILPPLEIQKNVYCVGRNYKDHIIEGNIANGRPANLFPEAIEFFSKPRTSVIGHGASVSRHQSLTNSLDYEVELAIVIGKGGTNISRENALDHVFGYTIVNDITARDLQKRHGQWLKGKSLDTTCPMGPVIAHHSAIKDPNKIEVGLSVNGEERQKENTSSMIFSIEAIIEQLSAGMTLEPGDVIATGTPKGVGFAMSPPKCLEVGDKVSAWVEGIGTLTNTVVD